MILPLFPNLGERIGSGVDGVVYALNDGTVVKFTPILDQQLIAEITTGQHPHFVEVLDFGRIDDLYFIVMERLNPLTDDEAKVFHTILSHEDRNLTKVHTPVVLASILRGLSTGLEFDLAEVMSFYAAVVLSTMSHNDLHPRNIMRANDGKFKLVDLNRLTRKDK